MSITKFTPKTHEEWLHSRTSTIGGSEISTIMGLNPYETPYQLWCRKRAELNGEYNEESNMAMRCGHYLEDAIAQMWEHETQRTIIKNSSGDWLFHNSEYPLAHVSPDRLYWHEGRKEKGLLECKSTLKNIQLNDFDNPTTLMYFTQVQWGLGISGLSHGSLACFKLGNRSFEYLDYDFNKEYFTDCYRKAEEFMHMVNEGIEPDVATASDVAVRYPNSDPSKEIQASDDAINAYNQLLAIREHIADLEAQKDALEESVKVAMLDCEVMTSSGKPIFTWRTSKDSVTFDSKRFKDENPDLFDKYSVTRKGSRRFVIK